MFDTLLAAEHIKDEFIGYISTSFHISDREYAKQFKEELEKPGVITKGPYLDISDSYKTGKSLEDMIREGEISPLFRELEAGVPENEKELQISRKLYYHQEQALRKINQKRNLIVTTGTGSGKTECFLIPIINELLREKEHGTLTSGVRAIIIYPMNALANDQMKRLRLLLKNYPDITFGVYNSSTKMTNESGIIEYGKVYKDQDGHAMKPIKNEIISREQMQKTPPHILVTNYAMLEYMMLRPKDDLVFSGADLRFLILDEAHIYHGATGMETALLLKRLKARISNPDCVRHILTSATLGGKEADDDIVKFAETLCSVDFKKEDIIRACTLQQEYDGETMDIPMSMFRKIAAQDKEIHEIAEEYGITVSQDDPEEEILYDLCTASPVYRDIRKIVDHPMTIHEIANKMQDQALVSEEDIINVINVAVRAYKNKTALIKARYHMFAKALEGAYIVMGKQKRLMLNRNRFQNIAGEEKKVFECAVCDECGHIAAVGGRSENGILEFANNSYDEEVEYFLPIQESDDFEENDTIDKNDYYLCTKCGTVRHRSLGTEELCGCEIEHYIKVRKADETNQKGKCPACMRGRFKTFYIGYNAATAVLGTSLFEELPESEKVFHRTSGTEKKKRSVFAPVRSSASMEMIKKKRQFLTFSDSRGEAAFFASYMTSSYKEFLRRRGIWHIVEKNKENMAERPWEIQTFVDELTAYFDSCKTFAEPENREKDNLTASSRKNAWIAILNEMFNARRSTSLASLGVIRFHFKGNTDEIMKSVAEAYHQSVEDTQALFDLLAMDVIYWGAIEGDCDLTDEEREYIFYSALRKRMICSKNTEEEKKSYLAGWCASARSNGKLIKNGRIKRVMKVLGLDEEEANALLEDYWESILTGPDGLKFDNKGEGYFSTGSFTIGAGNENTPMYQCDVCGKTTTYNCKSMCTTLSCRGHLHRISRKSLIEDNHYARLYSSSIMEPLHIKEHTAQLGREEQQKYQEMFVNKEINALSCSTTFEMGVDVGDLETVYLRDMPPSPANYVQRAGRAGRGRNAAAFALTYAKLSSHDFTYYKDPEKMITGKIGVPVFAVRNEKIILRHIFAVALSDFFAKNEDVYNQNNADIFLNENGWERLCAYLKSEPPQLKKLLEASIPEEMHDIMGITDYSWKERLIGKDGVLKTAVDEFRQTVQYYENEYEELYQKEDVQNASRIQKKLRSFRRGREDQSGRNDLIEFLVRSNVLPKYGFPVDTVELYQSANMGKENRLQMVRDLQLAVSEYAPNAQVVADGKLYTSRYIRKLPQATGQEWETGYIAQCPNSACKTWNQLFVEPGEEEICFSCHEVIPHNCWEKAIEPRMGFIAENKSKDVPMRRPERAYRGDDHYIGDTQRKVIDKYEYQLQNGQCFQLETSVNDSLMVVCNDKFYVCPKCGYAVGTRENREKDTEFHDYQKNLRKKHDTPWGRTCDGILLPNRLYHVFKTDVVHVRFLSPRASDQEVMLSVMYALLEAVSSVLDIERNDIRGCLHKTTINGRMLYSVILYDAVAGGAGHVRRIVTEQGDIFQKIVSRAIEITKGCNCSPSCYNCLRNYYNQRIHEKLNRKYAYEFLENYCSEIKKQIL